MVFKRLFYRNQSCSPKTILFVIVMIIAAACTTSPTGRKQFIVVPEAQMSQMGAQAFDQMKASQPIERDPKTVAYVNCIVGPLGAVVKEQAGVDHWDVVVFKDDQVNAFALPGGKVGVYTGIIKVAKTDAQLSAVIGHEIGHVIAHHGAERVSQQAGTQLGLAALGAITPDNPKKSLLMGLLGVGLQVGVMLPYSRTQESEADVIGLDIMAQAGFDPRQSVELWQNMIAAAGGGGPPELLSTHPASPNRIANLQAHMPEAEQKYARAKALGRNPKCTL